ncbi:hypothetical protein RRF57_012811 [Xylaria bambusicola]|uniref:Uncharacterized protein n=1 Tax=Xylaria bambusicola TaxID=326684 RepID=A0AAN7V5Z9_9PEZI
MVNLSQAHYGAQDLQKPPKPGKSSLLMNGNRRLRFMSYWLDSLPLFARRSSFNRQLSQC